MVRAIFATLQQREIQEKRTSCVLGERSSALSVMREGALMQEREHGTVLSGRKRRPLRRGSSAIYINQGKGKKRTFKNRRAEKKNG